jgi:phage terminase small subunit
MLPASIHQSASRLSRSVKVRTALARRRELAASRAAVTADRVLAELARIGFADLSVYEELLDGGELSDLPSGAAAALSEVTVDTYQDGRGAGAREVRRVRLKLHPKLAALEALGKHLGLFAAELDDGYGIPDTRPVEDLTLGELRSGILFMRSAGALPDPPELRDPSELVELPELVELVDGVTQDGRDPDGAS